MRDWSQSKRDIFYKTQFVHEGNHNAVSDRCGWIKEKHKEWMPKSYLDIACRDGYVTRCFLNDSSVCGIDINDEAIKIADFQAKTHFPRGDAFYLTGSILDDPDLPEAEAVVSFEFIEHIPEEEAKQVIAKMHRHSTRLCAISTPTDTGKFGVQNVEDSGHINVYSARRLVEAIKEMTGIDPSLEATDDFLYAWWFV